MHAAWLKPFGETRNGAFLPFLAVCAICFIAPLFVWPAAQDSFVLPKWSLLGMALWLLAAAALGIASGRTPLRLPLHPINGLLAAFLAWQLMSALWSASRPLTFLQSVQTATVLGICFLIQSVVSGDRRALLSLSLVVASSAFCVAVWTVLVDAAAGFGTSGGFRIVLGDWRDAVSTAGFGNTGHIADFLVAGFFVTTAHALTTRSRIAFGVFALSLWTLAAALIVCWSVHSNLSLIIAAVAFLVFTHRWNGSSKKRRMLLRRLGVLGSGWLLVVLFYVVDHPANPHGREQWIQNVPESIEASGLPGIFGQAFSSPRWKAGGPTRLVIWLTTLEAASSAPWLGHGAGTFTWIYPAMPSELVMANPELAPYAGSWTNAAHNSLLQTWSELGIVGVFLLVSLAGCAMMAMHARLNREGEGNGVILATSLSMMIALVVQSLFSFPLELPVSLLLFAVLLSVPVMLPPRRCQADLNLPVIRRFGPLEAGILLKNMRVPTELRIALSVSPPARIGFGAVLLGLASVAAWNSTSLLRASVAYRPAYEARASGNADRVINQCRTALKIDGRLADCRSALTDQLVQSGRHEEALGEIEQLLPWLNATEVHVRRAVSLDALGRPEEANESWDVVFGRAPAWGQVYPSAFRRWLQRQQNQTSL